MNFQNFVSFLSKDPFAAPLFWIETFSLFSDTMRWPGHAGIEKEIDWKDDFYIQVSYFSSLRSLHTFRECIWK